MSRLTANTKHLILELHVNADWSTRFIIETIAAAFNIKVGERPNDEYVQLRNIKHMQQEIANDTQPMEH